MWWAFRKDNLFIFANPCEGRSKWGLPQGHFSNMFCCSGTVWCWNWDAVHRSMLLKMSLQSAFRKTVWEVLRMRPLSRRTWCGLARRIAAWRSPLGAKIGCPCTACSKTHHESDTLSSECANFIIKSSPAFLECQKKHYEVLTFLRTCSKTHYEVITSFVPFRSSQWN